MSDESRQLAAYVRQVSGFDRRLEELVVGFFLAFREELRHDVKTDDPPAVFAMICRCLDLPSPSHQAG